jgi:hypothetical protein
MTAAALARIIGTASVADVEAAFTCQHPSIDAYRWAANVSIKGEVIIVEGMIFENDTEIGHFSRRLFYEDGVGQAIHEIMEIERPHRDRDIGKHHYARAITFYERVRIRYISMEAEGEGPVVWPTFGFDFSRRQHRDMLIRILKQWEVEPLPSPASILAPQVVDISTEDHPELGMEAIYELARRASEPLPMSLDLQNPIQRAYLHHRGII